MSEVAEQKRSRLPLALGIAIGLAIITTIVSVAIYHFAGFYKLDLSRPGFETERADIESNIEQSFDSTTPLTKEALDNILEDYDTRIDNLKSYGDFRDSPLSDDRLLQQ